jgi:hypothetical protein
MLKSTVTGVFHDSVTGSNLTSCYRKVPKSLGFGAFPGFMGRFYRIRWASIMCKTILQRAQLVLPKINPFLFRCSLL